jgi:hypothetical protein
MIYFMRAGVDGPVKIGWSTNIPSRMSSLQTGQPFKMNLLRILDAPRWAERWLHYTFEDIRLEGEWFNFSEEMLTIEPPKDGPHEWATLTANKPFQMRTTDAWLSFLDDWRRQQTSIPSRAEAIRQLVEIGLEATPSAFLERLPQRMGLNDTEEHQ